MPGQKSPPSAFIPSSTSSIDLIKPTSVQTGRTIQTTLTHFITLYSGTNTILSSIEEVSTRTLGPNEQLQSTTTGNYIQSSRPAAEVNQLVPSVSTLFRTHTLYTTLYSDGNPTISSKEHITSSLLTVYVPQSQINAQINAAASSINAKSSLSSLDPVMTMFTTYTFYTTNKPNEIVSSFSTATQYVTVSNSDGMQSLLNTPSYKDQEIKPSSSIIDEQFMRTSAYQPESGNTIYLSSSFKDEIPILSSSYGGELPNESSFSSGVNNLPTSKLPAIFDTNVHGKSTTVIDGSTVVFFTDFIFPSASHNNENADAHSATETNHIAKGPAGDNINLVVDNSSPYDDAHAHLPKDPTKDESDLINSSSSTSIKPGQVIDLSDILGSSSIGGGDKTLSDTIKDIVQLIAANTNKLNKNKQDANGAPVYLPNPPLYKDQVSSVYIENPFLNSDQIGVHQHQRPHLDQIAPSFANGNLESNNDYQASSIRPSMQGDDSTRPAMFDINNNEQPVSTKYLTSVESSTRTLTLTTTKVYYTRDSPLTITSVLTTTIKPRTFVTTIIGSRTVRESLLIFVNFIH